MLIKFLKFPDNQKVCFLRSKRVRLNKICKQLTYNSIPWKRMTAAHLTPFYVSNDGIELSWHIDADDTFFILDAKEIGLVLSTAEQFLQNEKLDALSLDMWATQTKKNIGGQWWTLGVALIRNSKKIKSLFEKPIVNWKDNMAIQNLDAYFAFLNNNYFIKAKTFYVENCFFIHCGANIIKPLFRPLSFWSEGRLHFPIVERVFGNDSKGVYVIPNDIIKFDIGLSAHKSIEKLNKFLN